MVTTKSLLVLAGENDPQLARLNMLPHTTGGATAAFEKAATSATAILNWSAPRELLPAVFARCPNLVWIHSRSTGVDNLLFPELIESNVVLTNGRGVFSASLGEFALGAILYFAKDFRRMLRNQAAGVWEPFDVDAIADRVVGIVGYGDIGRAVASRVHAIGMRVLALKRHVPEIADPLIERFYEPALLCKMLAQCDYVVVAAPLTGETRHLIDEGQLAAMKPDAVLINVGRGPVIHQAALVQALTAKRIKGAALDVFEDEPLPAGHPLYRLENVLLSPHCADNTRDWKDQAMTFFLEQYRKFQSGVPLDNVVNKRLGY